MIENEQRLLIPSPPPPTPSPALRERRERRGGAQGSTSLGQLGAAGGGLAEVLSWASKAICLFNPLSG